MNRIKIFCGLSLMLLLFTLHVFIQAQKKMNSLDRDAMKRILSLLKDSILYGASITIADVIIPDGKSLENVGVTPNKLLLPKPADIAANRDPVLAEALNMLGVRLSPADAGGKFEYDWQNNGSVVLKPVKR